MTLTEVIIAILLVMVVTVAAITTRYLATKQAGRGDAYHTAGKLGATLLEGWRSVTTPALYNPVARFSGQMPIGLTTSTMAPPTPTGFTTLGRYHVLLDNVHYYVTLAYIPENVITEQPAVLHATVGFRHQYQAASVTTSGNYVRLTTYD